MKTVMNQLFKEEKAQGLIEYSLLIAFIAIALIVSVQLFGDAVLLSLNDSKDKIVKTAYAIK